MKDSIFGKCRVLKISLLVLLLIAVVGSSIAVVVITGDLEFVTSSLLLVPVIIFYVF